ncbi:IS30 family transposase [Candidatus Parcubacteria bacterium]|nr:IS30 family transposase [Candidatus Parcubacteria bacterium]
MSFKHFTPENKNELSILLRAGLKQVEVAKLLKKTPSAICQELKRNPANTKTGYSARISKINSRNRRIKANKRFRKLDNNKWLRNYIHVKIKLKWSPEQISGRLKISYPDDRSRRIGKDSIYKYIYSERKDLVKYLRCQKGKYRRRYGTRIREKQREKLKKKRIDKRPKEVEEKSRIGDWEGDTIVGKDKSHILTHVDRKSGYAMADKLIKGLAELTRIKTQERFNKLPKNKKLTITYDNGSIFAEHELTEKKTGIDIYFAWPYHSWERGCNENFNGLLRQFFPKKSSFANIKQEDIEKAVKLINNRPRKRLNYKTPAEVFRQKN